MPKSHDTAAAALRKFGLAFPGAHSKSPWPEHDDLAVKDKTFAFMSETGRPLSISVKLTVSHATHSHTRAMMPTIAGCGGGGR